MNTGMTELCVHMCCGGCEAKIRKALQHVKGVSDVEIDMAMQKVTVIGWADQKKVLKAARKTGRRAVLWPYDASGHGHTITANYSEVVHGGSTAHLYHPACGPAPSSSYNYYVHGYDDSTAYQHRLSRGSSNNLGEKARAFFSNENPNACSIM